MTSPEKIAANRRNAGKSTGPKTSEGKTRSARNAVKHGLTARPEDDPSGPPEAFRESLAGWIGDLKPKGIVEQILSERACRAAWNLRRCDRYEDAMAAKRDRDAADRYDLDQAARADALGRRLVTRTLDTDGNPLPDAEDPAPLVNELRTTAAGVDWLLERWGELGRAISESGDWDDAREFAAIRMLGVRLEAVGDHPIARKIAPTARIGGKQLLGSVFGSPATRGLLDAAAEAGESGIGDTKTLWTECFLAIAHRAQDRANPTLAAARLKTLRSVVVSERAKLARLMRRTLKARAAEDRAGAADRSLFDESRSLSLRLRYATDASRDLHRTIADLLKLRKASEREDRDDGPGTPGPESGPSRPPLVDEIRRNEPNSGPEEAARRRRKRTVL